MPQLSSHDRGSRCPSFRRYLRPPEMDVDYGVPQDEYCKETAAGSGVFTREWTKASVQIDCKSWTPTITMKH